MFMYNDDNGRKVMAIAFGPGEQKSYTVIQFSYAICTNHVNLIHMIIMSDIFFTMVDISSFELPYKFDQHVYLELNKSPSYAELIYTIKSVHAVTSIKQSPVLKGHIFLS